MAEHIEYGTTGKPHPYHIVRPSIWPLVGSLAGGLFTFGLVLFMHEKTFFGIHIGMKGALAGLLLILATMFFWWKDVIFESVTEKVHNQITEIGLRFGMMLFIASEVMFFVAFFWAFFSASMFPNEGIGFVWPPTNIEIIEPFGLPFLMTMILLLSGCTVTWAHHAILEGKTKGNHTSTGPDCSARCGLFMFPGF